MNQSIEVLFKLLRIALGSESDFSLPSDVDWKAVVDLAFDQGVAALAVDGLQKFYDANSTAELALDAPEMEELRYEWFGEPLRLEEDNAVHNKRAAGLTKLFSDAGFRSCILKGQGNALLYPDLALRQCGDIDIWVEGGRRKVLAFLRSKFRVTDAVVHHADVEFFRDMSVEVHYLPAWLYDPMANRRLQRFFAAEADAQFANMTELGFAMPEAKFNLVFCAVHLAKHYFQGESNLKQMVDYYYILKKSTSEDRASAMDVLKSVGLGKFVSWLMGQLELNLGLDSSLALCEASFGSCRRPFGEALCMYPWKVWHWFARKKF